VWLWDAWDAAAATVITTREAKHDALFGGLTVLTVDYAIFNFSVSEYFIFV
jgi:hypothetical protein